MPYKSEKIKIAGGKYDRRVKLTPEQKKPNSNVLYTMLGTVLFNIGTDAKW